MAKERKLSTNLSPLCEYIELYFHKTSPLDLRSGILYSKAAGLCNKDTS